MLATSTRKRNVSSRGKKDSKKARFDKIMSDFIVFCEEFVRIVDNHAQLVPFKLNGNQIDFVTNMSKYNLILKARQLGFSVTSLAICLFSALKKPNTNYLIVSLDKEQATELFTRLKRMNDNLPRDKYPYFPETVIDNRDALILSNGSKIQISVPKEVLGRGSTYEYILLSEFSYFKSTIQSSLLAAVTNSLAKSPSSQIVIETTANSLNYFYDLYKKSEAGKTNYKAFFYSWLSDAHRQLYDSEIKEAVSWYEANYKKRLSEKDLVTDEEKRLFKSGASLNQLMWRLYKLSSADNVEKFKIDFPSTADEAFVMSANNYVFNQEKIIERLNHIPQPLDNEVLRKNIPADLHKWIGKGLNVYKLPLSGQKYWGGCDPSGGTGNDSTALTIINAEGEEILSFANNKISIYDAAEFLNSICRYYNQVFLAVERNGFGLPLIEKLRKDYQYINLYRQKTFDMKGKRKLIEGWLMSDTNKPILIANLKEQFEKGLILINNKETLEEMKLFIEDKNGRLGNQPGNNNHDDLVISIALAIESVRANRFYV